MKDVVIIGGGIVGLWCAYFLKKEGRGVTILDKGDLKDGCSFGNAGMIVPSHFIPLASPGIISKGIQWMFKKNSPFYIRPRLSLELAQWLWLFYKSSTRKHVAESAAILRDMHTESREMYRQLNQMPGFNFEFDQKGILMLFKSAEGEKDELETAEIAHSLGIVADQLTTEKLKLIEPGLNMSVRGAVHYPGDAHLSPHIFMKQMLDHLKQSGVECLSNYEVVHLIDQEKGGCQIFIKNGEKVLAQHVVVATGSWSGHLMKKSGYSLPMQDGKGYSMTMQDPVIKSTIPSILHEARVAITPMGNDLRIAGTLEISGMDDRINKHKLKFITDAVTEYYPQLKVNDPGPIWYGYRPCTPDGLPYVGRNKEGSSIILATGHAMMGLSLAPATGSIIKDNVLRENKEFAKLDPKRFG